MVIMRRNNRLATPTQEIQKKSQVHQDLWILGDFSDVTLVCDDDQTKIGGQRPPSLPQELEVKCAKRSLTSSIYTFTFHDTAVSKSLSGE
jgi:hypothetical protein